MKDITGREILWASLMILFWIIYAMSCSSVPASDLRITKDQWKLCWELCGKKDKLSAVEGKMCVCEGGYHVNSEPEKAPEPSKPFSLAEWLGLKGDGS